MLQTENILNKRYKLIEKIGRNSSLQTWLATDLQASPPQKVILKLLVFNPLMSWEYLKLFEREASVLKKIDHPSIPKYIDYFYLDTTGTDLNLSTLEMQERYSLAASGLPYFALVQQYISGQCLKDILEKGKLFTEKEVRLIATQVLDILIYLHELSPPIFHRDIKPSNLIVGEDDKIYLVDFGAVQDKAKAEGATFTVVGTTGYTPPEQLWGKAVAASDLYALGATLVHLLTGVPPTDLPKRKMQIQFLDKVKLDRDLARWLEKLLQPDPQQRFATAFQAWYVLKYQLNSKRLIQKYRKTNFWSSNLLDFLPNFENLVPAIIVSILIFLMSPSLIDAQNRGRQRDSKNYVEKLTQKQKKYAEKKQSLADSIPQLGLIESNNCPKCYGYFIVANNKAAFHYAVPIEDSFKGYVGGVFLVPATEVDANAASDEMRAIAILCETNSPGTSTPPAPTLKEGTPVCAEGTQQLGGR